jgi:hypothetical protein
MNNIIKQGDWGYGDTHGLAKAVDVGYKKWLKKNGLEPEGNHRNKGGRPRKNFSYGKKTEK